MNACIHPVRLVMMTKIIMKTYCSRSAKTALCLLLMITPVSTAMAMDIEGEHYHGQLGRGTGTGMLEKWSPLYNFSFDQQGGIEGWSEAGCDDCHIGANWNANRNWVNCFVCHEGDDFSRVTADGCMTCHATDTNVRGDSFTAGSDAHVSAGFTCHDCHLKVSFGRSDHQFLKGPAIDTTEATLEGTLSCTRFCHSSEPHPGRPDGDKLNQHTDKVACETCHASKRPSPALASVDWTAFDSEGRPVTTMHRAGWAADHGWYDNTGPGADGHYEFPVLDAAARKDVAGARIYPFNTIRVNWYVKQADADDDDIIIVPEVLAADANGDGKVTLGEMQLVYPQATLRSKQFSYSINHSVRPREQAIGCDDCHGGRAWLLDWVKLGYGGDPGGKGWGEMRRKKP